jgi:MbtH protein
MSDQIDSALCKVVVNSEEQFSIWPAGKENAPGWRDAGQEGTKEECLAYIEKTWTDMRPASVRRAMEQDIA